MMVCETCVSDKTYLWRFETMAFIYRCLDCGAKTECKLDHNGKKVEMDAVFFL